MLERAWRKGNPPTLSVEMLSWCSHSGEQDGGSLKVKRELPYDPAIPLLGIYPDKTIIRKDTHTPTFIAALFTPAKTWKQPKCPQTDEWIKKMWYIYTQWDTSQP